MPAWKCEDCAATNRSVDRACERCGAVRPEGVAAGYKPDVPLRTECPLDGAPLHANGWCEVGNGVPITRSCPFVCDQCRQRLTWSGTCLSCERYAPGDRYELDEKSQHWMLAERGPFALLTRQQNAHMAAEFAETMQRLMVRMVGRKA